MSEKIRVGMIGAGQIANSHMKRYQDIPEAEIVAVSDLFPEKMAKAQATYGIPNAHDDFKDLLARDDIDSVDVCVHNNKHAPITIAALEAGKNVYCEKPMAGTYRDAADMAAAAEASGRKLNIQMNTVFSQESLAAKRLIDDGNLGKLYYARSFGYRRRGRPFVDGYGTANFVDKTICAGGALFDMGIYHIANIMFLLDNPEVLTVTGTTHQELDMYEDRREFSNFSVEEMGLGWARLAGGISFDIEETWAVHHDGSEASKVCGSKGGIKLNPLTYFSSLSDMPMSSTFDLKGSNTRWHSCFPETAWYDSSQKHWIGALLGKVPLLPCAEYALNTALISEGIFMSAKLGRELSADEIREKSVSTAIDPYTPEKVWG
ncbi:MAG: Gfo/Idh/MocA family oxidoreductase [Lentisphaerae bacterium]|jgi:predicted dehydrogenase|nr:Gfo/Idh/MocA family oxidoreductase [Lentisphaerota bacterium]MBT4816519.1 Gfo/Idh/MocA family oxidoreductase [Lentisphaerota bacterium]MBT5605043.1 Gfo/Idh/MocA family oxidoreductase [Lentisphaerota bacterium]MBT7058665.1 Gfo/Idh/MocA family oxidoreductase [Lentisphaerota bacterium]MBT7847006.1 Gfo/Idh/MocA family oxidoreductase [Lentisphaerota bacterium]